MSWFSWKHFHYPSCVSPLSLSHRFIWFASEALTLVFSAGLRIDTKLKKQGRGILWRVESFQDDGTGSPKELHKPLTFSLHLFFASHFFFFWELSCILCSQGRGAVCSPRGHILTNCCSSSKRWETNSMNEVAQGETEWPLRQPNGVSYAVSPPPCMWWDKISL